MPIMIERLPRGRNAPVIICDHCGKRIEDAKQGNFEWEPLDGEPGGRTAVYFLHKTCSSAHDELFSEGLMTDGLTVFVPWLAGNIKLDWETAKEKADEAEWL